MKKIGTVSLTKYTGTDEWVSLHVGSLIEKK